MSLTQLNPGVKLYCDSLNKRGGKDKMNCQEALDVTVNFMDFMLNRGHQILEKKSPLQINLQGLGIFRALEAFQHLKQCDGLCSYYWSLLNGTILEIKEKIK